MKSRKKRNASMGSDLERELKEGFDLEYLAEVIPEKEKIGDQYYTPGFGLAAQLFCSVAKPIMERLGPEEGKALMVEAIKDFGLQRGRRIAERVQSLGLPLTFKNWLIYGDIDSGKNFQAEPSVEDGDLFVRVHNCTFYNAAEAWQLGDMAHLYCHNVDYAILEGYNPQIKLILEERQATGKDYCLFRYIMKEANK